jgi:hypothetical protein
MWINYETIFTVITVRDHDRLHRGVVHIPKRQYTCDGKEGYGIDCSDVL